VTDSIAVLGGGLAGLAAAAVTGAPVFEATACVGGTAASDSALGFTFDRGIHVLQTANLDLLVALEGCGICFGERSRQAYIHSRDTYTAYPFQVNTAGLPLSLRWRCVRDFLLRERGRVQETYLDWMYANLGRGFSDSFLVPYSEKFWTLHPSEMTHEWTGARVPQPSALQVIRGALWNKQTAIGTNARFRYPDSDAGFGAIGEGLAKLLPPVQLSHRAQRVDWRRRCVDFDNGHQVYFEHLISTIPLPALVDLCIDAPTVVREAAARLRSNSIRVVNLGIDRPGRNNWHWAHFPEPDISFFRISFPHNLFRGVVPNGMSSVSAELAYSAMRPLPAGNLVDRVVADLIRVGVLDRSDPVVFSDSYDIPTAYCIHDRYRQQAVGLVRDWLAGVGIITAGRYGTWSYMWSDQALLSGIEAGGLALRKASRQVNSGQAGRLGRLAAQ
jgi:UDP-galactopyranose mutase